MDVDGPETGAGGRPGRLSPSPAGIVAALCVAALTVFACFVLYRVGRAVESAARTAARLGDRLDSIGVQVERATSSAAEISRSVGKLAARVERLSEKLEAMDEWAEAMRLPGGELRPDDEKLIDELLGCVRRSGLKFVRGGQEKSAWRMYAWLWAKYRMWKPTIASAGDFIEKVGTKQVVGEPYQVIEPGGTKRPLAGWLAERLAELRAARKRPGAAGAAGD